VCDGVYTQTTSFAVNITPVNDSPVISDIDNCTTEEETPISINFTVSDVESTTDNLSITINSSNFDLIPYGSLDIKQNAREAGVDNFLIKPINQSVLLDAVVNHFYSQFKQSQVQSNKPSKPQFTKYAWCFGITCRR
jgi:Response regulator containing a CheY-like receiver domain and an HD-GYP domain